MIYLAFFWHFHQPFYKDSATGEYLLPWVRLHGIKDYTGMALILKDYPEIRQTFNFVPCMLQQLEEYSKGIARDKFLKLSELSQSELLEKDVHFILDNFFSAQWENMVEVHPRYRELLHKRAFGKKSVDRATRDFGERDIRDLQVWANLSWFHPLVIQSDQELKALIQKGRDFTEAEKQLVLAKEIQVIRDILPLYKKLEDSGQIETTTSPFYHPILPLLCDPLTARQALPKIPLPETRLEAEEDARLQVERAVSAHEMYFGRRPRGLWPSEGAVSHHIIPILSRAGIKWTASDEEILARSLHIQFSRDDQGKLNLPRVLYKPYKLESGDSQVNIIFRDHSLSDLIGFQYQRYNVSLAVEDFIKRIKSLKDTPQPLLVSVILDGENAWEYYPNNGLDFLRKLYSRLQEEKGIKTVRVSDYMEMHPPQDTIKELYAGSWIGHNLATWVGHEEKNKAWNYLAHARDYLKKAGPRDTNHLDLAWEQLYIAEGSDWFWWYGDDHSSAYDETFDRLFRTHLKNLYKFMSAVYPRVLDVPILRPRRKRPYSLPKGFLQIKLDGKVSSFLEWISAGRFVAKDTPVMHRASGRVVTEAYFGFDEENFYLRLDFEEGEIERIGTHDKVLVTFLHPHEARLCIPGPLRPTMDLEVLRGPSPRIIPGLVATGEILELRCPFSEIGLAPTHEVEFLVEIEKDGQVSERIPEHYAFAFTTPTKDFERILWQV